MVIDRPRLEQALQFAEQPLNAQQVLVGEGDFVGRQVTVR
jgi:hypothetical protein